MHTECLLWAGKQKLELAYAAEVLNSSRSLLASALARDRLSSCEQSRFPKFYNRNGRLSVELGMQNIVADGHKLGPAPWANLKQFVWSLSGTGQEEKTSDIHLQLWTKKGVQHACFGAARKRSRELGSQITNST